MHNHPKPSCPQCKRSDRVTRTVGRWLCLRCNKFFNWSRAK